MCEAYRFLLWCASPSAVLRLPRSGYANDAGDLVDRRAAVIQFEGDAADNVRPVAHHHRTCDHRLQAPAAIPLQHLAPVVRPVRATHSNSTITHPFWC